MYIPYYIPGICMHSIIYICVYMFLNTGSDPYNLLIKQIPTENLVCVKALTIQL